MKKEIQSYANLIDSRNMKLKNNLVIPTKELNLIMKERIYQTRKKAKKDVIVDKKY